MILQCTFLLLRVWCEALSVFLQANRVHLIARWAGLQCRSGHQTLDCLQQSMGVLLRHAQPSLCTCCYGCSDWNKTETKICRLVISHSLAILFGNTIGNWVTYILACIILEDLFVKKTIFNGLKAFFIAVKIEFESSDLKVQLLAALHLVKCQIKCVYL